MAARAVASSAGQSRQFHQRLRAALIARAEAEFRLALPTPDGLTERDHLSAYERQTGRRVRELDLPKLPRGCAVLWDAFLDMNRTRRTSGKRFDPLAWSEIAAWQAACRIELNPWELDTIKALDDAILPILNRKKIERPPQSA